MRLCLARRYNDGNAHQPEQRLTVLIFLVPRPHQSFRLLVLLFHVPFFRRLLELGLRLFSLLSTFQEFPRFELRRFPVKNVGRFDAFRQEPDCPIEHALYVRRGFAVRVGQHGGGLIGPATPDRNHELINLHRRIDGQLSTLQRF